MLVRSLRALAPLALLCSFGCGDIGRVVMDVSFSSEDLELRTRALEVVVRETAEGVDGCDNLWLQQPLGLAEDRKVIAYPNRVDIRASPVNLDQYPALTLLVYAYPTADIETSEAIAGGCAESAVDPNASTELAIVLDPAP